MKDYSVSVDITVCKIFHVEAKNEEEARKNVAEKMRDAYYHAAHPSHVVCWDITDCDEE